MLFRSLANALRMHMLETKDTGVFPEGWKIDSSTDWQESLDAAWNSGSAIADEKRMRSLVAHPNASVRFWGAIAFRSANTEGVTKEIFEIVAPLQKDSSDEVRIVANEGFARHALDPQARTAAIDAIVKIVCADSTLWFARLRGLNAICDLEATLKQYELIASNHQQHHKEWVTKMPERYRGYLDRLIGRMETNAAKNPPE